MPRQPGKANPARYVSLPPRWYGDKSRRYVDVVTGEAISYDQRYKNLHKGLLRSTKTARRQGFKTRGEQERYRKEFQAKAARATLASRIQPKHRAILKDVPSPETRKRRRRALASRWAEYQVEQGRTDIPAVKRPNKFAYNTTWASSQPDFQALEERLAVLSEYARSHNLHRSDPFNAPDGEYAQTLVALGRRPDGFEWQVGDSPTGTVQAMQALGSPEGTDQRAKGERFMTAQQALFNFKAGDTIVEVPPEAGSEQGFGYGTILIRPQK